MDIAYLEARLAIASYPAHTYVRVSVRCVLRQAGAEEEERLKGRQSLNWIRQYARKNVVWFINRRVKPSSALPDRFVLEPIEGAAAADLASSSSLLPPPKV